METTEYSSGSSINRQETFATDSKHTNRSKSGSIRKGNLSLPVIGPRHRQKHNSADSLPLQPEKRALSPVINHKPIGRTYTKSLITQLPSQDLSNQKKVLNRLNRKQNDDDTDNGSILKDKRIVEEKKEKKINQLKDVKSRRHDTKSVESGDSLKENKVKSVQSTKPVREVNPKPQATKTTNSENSIKEIKKKESIVSENKTVPKQNKITEKKVQEKQLQQKEAYNSASTVNSGSDKQPLVNKHISNSSRDQPKNIPIETPAPQIKKTQEKTDEKGKKQDSEKAKLKREKLRDKLTSTPVSNFDHDLALNTTKQAASKVYVKETRLTTKVKTEDQKQANESVNKKDKFLSQEDKRENKLKTTNKSEEKTLKDQKEEKGIRRERKQNASVHLEDNTSKSKQKEKQLKTNPIIVHPNERKRSSDSLESGFASYRQNLGGDKDVHDVISLLSNTDTEVGKPPENTVLDRPRSDRSKVSLAIEQGRPASNKSRDFYLSSEKADKFKDYREFEKNRPSSPEVSVENKTYYTNLSNNRKMEPSVQRKPGSERMTESYESIYEERRTLLEAEAAYKIRIKQLEDEINQFLKTIEDLRSENRALRNRIDSLENAGNSGSTSEEEKLKITIQSLETQNKILETKQEKTETRLAKVEQERNTITSEKENLTSKFSDLEQKFRNLQKEQEIIQSENIKTTKQEEELKQLHIDLRTEQSERKKMDNENTILKTDKDVLKDEVVALRSINKNLEAMNEEMKNQSTLTGEFPSKEKMELKSQIIKLQTDNQTLNEENIKLKAENLQQVKSIHDLEKTAKTFESSVTAVESEKLSEIQDLKNENSKLKSDIKELKETFADADGKIKSLESANKALDDDLTQKKSELAGLMSALKDDDKFDEEIKTLKTENTKLRKLAEEKDESMAQSRRHLEEIKVEKDKFETEKNKLTKKANEMLEINEDQKKQMSDLREKLDLANVEIASNKEKLQQIQKYENEISEYKKKIETVQKEKETVMKEKQEIIEELKLKMERNVADHKEQTDALKFEYEKEIDELKKQVEFLQKEIDELRQLKVLESELIETKDELQQVKGKYSQMIVDLESKSDLEQKNFQMNMRMNQMNNNIKQLEKEQRDWLVKKQQFDEIEASNKSLQEENFKLKHRGSMHKVGRHVDRQIEVLERKQQDAETRVKQLEGWVGDLYEDDKHNHATYVGSLQDKRKTKKKGFTKAPPKLPQTTVRIEHDRPRSLDDVVIKEKSKTEKSEVSEKLSHRSSPLLPAIDHETRLTFGLGYTQLHRSRIKAAQKYRKY